MTYSPETGSSLTRGGRGVSERRFALKRATDAAHTRLEAIVQSGDMFGSVEGYRRYLAATYAMRDHFERLLDANGVADLWPDWPGRRIAGVVAQDMIDLGVAASPPQKFHHSRLQTAELLGALYVFEGSSLGGRLLVRMVSALGLSEIFGARHLFAHSDSHAAWRSFLGVLDASSQPPCQDTANAVFNAFADAYDQARA